MKIFTRLRLQFNHLNEHKFQHGFSDTISPIVHSELKLKLLNISSLVVIILNLGAKNQVYILLYGSQTNNSKSLNHETLKNIISCLKATARFDGPSINL